MTSLFSVFPRLKKHSSGGVLQKKCSQKFRKIHTQSLFNKVAGLFLNKVTGLRPAALLKMRLWHKCFSVNLVKFSRTPLQNTSGRKLLKLRNSNTFLHIYLLQKKKLNYRELLKIKRSSHIYVYMNNNIYVMFLCTLTL